MPPSAHFTHEQACTWRAMRRTFELFIIGVYNGDLGSGVADVLGIPTGEAWARIASVVEVAQLRHETEGLPEWL